MTTIVRCVQSLDEKIRYDITGKQYDKRFRIIGEVELCKFVKYRARECQIDPYTPEIDSAYIDCERDVAKSIQR